MTIVVGIIGLIAGTEAFAVLTATLSVSIVFAACFDRLPSVGMAALLAMPPDAVL